VSEFVIRFCLSFFNLFLGTTPFISKGYVAKENNRPAAGPRPVSFLINDRDVFRMMTTCITKFARTIVARVSWFNRKILSTGLAVIRWLRVYVTTRNVLLTTPPQSQTTPSLRPQPPPSSSSLIGNGATYPPQSESPLPEEFPQEYWQEGSRQSFPTRCPSCSPSHTVVRISGGSY